MIPTDRGRSAQGHQPIFGPKIPDVRHPGPPDRPDRRGISGFVRMWPRTNGWAPYIKDSNHEDAMSHTLRFLKVGRVKSRSQLKLGPIRGWAPVPPNPEVKVGPTLKVGPSALQTGPTFKKRSVCGFQMFPICVWSNCSD